MNALRRMRDRLLRKFRDPDYRHGYLNAYLNTSIAAQIRALREARNLSQKELGVEIGTQQSGVSALENVNYSRWSISTLRKLAAAFDVALIVKFVSFGEALDEITRFNASDLNKPAFADDPALREGAAQVGTVPELTMRATPAFGGLSYSVRSTSKKEVAVPLPVLIAGTHDVKSMPAGGTTPPVQITGEELYVH